MEISRDKLFNILKQAYIDIAKEHDSPKIREIIDKLYHDVLENCHEEEKKEDRIEIE